jgi:hypothetical protein
MYDLYEYISECAITATLSDVIYMYHSSCSVALAVRLTLRKERRRTFHFVAFSTFHNLAPLASP